ncbi:abortive infection family protein [Bradyrhizobium stylosanthis]|uniref:Abortive infection Abi-like protein n=1 Tax=Bradyrhizobium stylosanthis TaxID=1803665 RepID=A0A560EDN6_9BRAD|nr:abortive infection family protein [Bradyrhizobium stylosanthis]TWB07464.1 abortive infection Abi-like protein [Bradyrhizobium stylosanthis]
MAFTLQMLRALMDAHPDRAAVLRRHVEALEATIEEEPQLCLHRVRTLFEAVHATIAPQLSIDLSDAIEFPTRNSRIIKAMDFSVPNHPDAEKINIAIAKLLGSINGTAAALAELSNIPNLRHGGSLDWGTLERQHAMMLGGVCDTLASFLFDVAWSRSPASVVPTEQNRYEEFGQFNTALDNEYETVEIVGSKFLPSRILFALDPILYEAARVDWAEQAASAQGEEAGA